MIHTLNILQQILEDFQSVSYHFGNHCIKRYTNIDFCMEIIKEIFLILATDLPLIFLKVFIVRQLEFLIQQLVAILTFFIILKRLRTIVLFSLSKNFVANFFNMLFIQKMSIKNSHIGGQKKSLIDGPKMSFFDKSKKFHLGESKIMFLIDQESLFLMDQRKVVVNGSKISFLWVKKVSSKNLFAVCS